MTSHPLPQQVTFVALHEGKVHIVASNPGRPEAPLRRIGDGPPDPIAAILGLTPTRCGRQIARNQGQGPGSGAGFIADFDDERLCAACHRTVPADQQHRLFAHPQATR